MSHPDIFIRRLELPYFEDPDYFKMSPDEFEKLFNHATGKKAIGFKRPDYLSKPECPERISKHLPEAKLIVSLRHPVKRAISAYYHYVGIGLAPLEDVNIGLRNILDGKYSAQFPRTRDIIEYGYYYKHLTNYLKYFERDQIFITIQDDIESNYNKIMKNILSFLDLQQNYDFKWGASRPGSVLYHSKRLRYHRWMNQIKSYYSTETNSIVFKNDQWHIREVLVGVANTFDKTVLNLIYKNNKPLIQSNLIKDLTCLYKEDITNLQGLLNRDMGNWLENNRS